MSNEAPSFEDEFERVLNGVVEGDGDEVPTEEEPLFEEEENAVEEETEEEEKQEAVPSPHEEHEQEEEVDWEALYLEEQQRRKTTEGRFKKAREEWKQKEEEFSHQEEKEEDVETDHKEFWEEYSELLPPIKTLVTKIVSEEVERAMSNISEIKEQLKVTKAETHRERIERHHPDLVEIATGDEIKDWMNSLPYRSDKGMDGETAWEYFNNGTADEVISLLDAFKSRKGIGNEKENNELPKASTQADAVKRAMAAMAVESGSPRLPETEKKNLSFEEEFNSLLNE